MKTKRIRLLILLVLILSSILLSTAAPVGAYGPGCIRYCPGDARGLLTGQ